MDSIVGKFGRKVGKMGKRKKLRWKEGKEEDIILNIKF
jgi:hypothetical protein